MQNSECKIMVNIYMKKTWNEKLNDSKNMPLVEICPVRNQKMLITPPIAYDEVMKIIPRGKLITADRIRTYLAKKHNADFTCQLTAGIFINIAANASAERKGENETAYWRTLKKDGELCEKFPGGIEGHKTMLQTEGHKIKQKGKRCFVADYAQKLFEFADIKT